MTRLFRDRASAALAGRFGFETWLDFDLSFLEKLLEEARDSQGDALTAPIWESDQKAMKM
ncbi:hypothetical protein [Nostoc sp.]|uniref:hypothetical protein n=1 Tax=Nostoc sp. TaxID=1180 RepID=UPI002FF810E4